MDEYHKYLKSLEKCLNSIKMRSCNSALYLDKKRGKGINLINVLRYLIK